MQSSWGKNIVYSLFGESHGTTIGITIHHLPAGIRLNLEAIQNELNRRRAGGSTYTTARQEKDQFEIVSGYFKGYTTGAPLTAMTRNTDQRSRDYAEIRFKMRPSHADYAANVKYKGYNDYRGGGHFSGRLTAPIVFAGAIAKQLLEKKGIKIAAHITQIGNVRGKRTFCLPHDGNQSLHSIHHDPQGRNFAQVARSEDALDAIKTKAFPVLDASLVEKMKHEIEKAKAEGDSVGGGIEVIALDVPAGIGEPFFNSVESTLAHLFYSIPAVKAVAFGSGFGIASMRGSEANDELYYDAGKVKNYTNHNGGVTGGITNAMSVIARLHFKPTPSIGKDQRMVDIESKENIVDHIEGRHDPCIIPRAVPVVEAMMAIGLLELYMDYRWSERWCADGS